MTATPRPSISFLLAAIVVAGILYGSLYPFIFHFWEPGNPLSHLLSTWRNPPQSRGDLLANVLIYIPVGFAVSASVVRLSLRQSLAVIFVGAAVLSVSIELLQYYDEGRVSCLSDVYLNVSGALAGWFCYRSKIVDLTGLSVPQGGLAIFARILLATWLGWRLFPYVPTIDLHKYWASLKPVFLTPSLNPFAVFRYAVVWLSVSFLIQLGVHPKRLSSALLTVISGYFLARILIVDQVVVLPEICGAAFVLATAPTVFMRREGGAIRSLAVIFFVMVIAIRTSPWQFSGSPREFGWVPFSSFLHGSLQIDLISFMEKVFLYGTLFLLLVQSGLATVYAAVMETLAILATSILAVHLRDRSGEITDALLVVILTAIYLILVRQFGAEDPSTKSGGVHLPTEGLT